MDVGGQAADQLTKCGIELTEESIKLLASGGKNLTAFLMALARDNKKLKGKTNLKRLLKENVPMRVFQIKEEDFEKFRQLARQYGILYSGVRSKSAHDGIVELLSNDNYVSQINYVMEALGYPVPAKEAETPKKSTARAQPEKCSPERGNGSTPTKKNSTNKKPSVKGRLAALEAASKSARKTLQREQEKIR